MIAEILHKLAEFENKGNGKYYPRPSLAGPGRCLRSMVYWKLGQPRKPFPGRTMFIFDDGTWHEELSADWIRKSSFKLHSEQMKVDCGTNYGIHLVGSIDGIITDPLEVDRLWEHKAINHFTFQRFLGGELPFDYITQVCLYIRGAQKYSPDISEGILLIKNKNTAAYLEFRLIYDRATDTVTIPHIITSTSDVIKVDETVEGITDNAFKKFAHVRDYAERQTLPKRDYDIDDWHCEYCGWGKLCWGDYEKEFKELKTDTILPDEFTDMVRYYKELGGQKKDIENEYDTLKDKIKKAMKEIDTREGKAGEYLCRLRLEKREYVDKNLLTPAEIEKASKRTVFEKLYISQPKKKGAKNGQRVQAERHTN